MCYTCYIHGLYPIAPHLGCLYYYIIISDPNLTARKRLSFNAQVQPCNMALVQDYSSDEDDMNVSTDIFGLKSLPAAKKPRVDEPTPMTVAKAAPDVLSEVGPLSLTMVICYLPIH